MKQLLIILNVSLDYRGDYAEASFASKKLLFCAIAFTFSSFANNKRKIVKNLYILNDVLVEYLSDVI